MKLETSLIRGVSLQVALCAVVVAAPEGLDALSDDALMNELASRNLNTLLDRAFEVNRIPPAEQKGRRTLLALGRLGDPSVKLTPAQRQRLVDDIISGIEPALPTINDPKLLMRQAVVLINSGVERDVNTLEYWGENPRTQARLRPVVETVIRILARSTELARKQAEELANQIDAPGSPMLARYEEMERLAATAEYNQRMVEYYLALALDKSSPQRRQLCDQSFEYLKQFDVDENPDRNIVRSRMAKLALAGGNLDVARQYFDLVTESPTAEKKNVQVQYEARYFAALTELAERNIESSRKHLEDLLAWQAANLPKDDSSQKGADAAAAMLRYRIALMESDQASDPAAKKVAADRATAILVELMSRRPDLRSVIYDQLLPRMDENADLAQADPMLLRALVARGEEQLRRDATDEPPDAKTIERALAAAREVTARRAGPAGASIDPQLADSSALLVGFFLKAQDKPIEAAGALLDYAQQYRNSNLASAKMAMDHAQVLIGQLRASDRRDEPQVVALYERFLPLAIDPPLARTQFAFEYARRLQLAGNAQEAIKYFQLISSTDERALDARYFELVARKQQLDELPHELDRTATLLEIQRLADEVSKSAQSALARPDLDPSRQASYRLMLARTSLLAADLARREQKDPKRALQLLLNFEASVQQLPQANELAADAMLIRVQSYMAQEQYTEATTELVKLLNRTEGALGAQIVYNLLEKLNADFDRAQAAEDAEQMRALARSRAQLSGFLVQWAQENPDESIRRFTYRYKVFDAETQRLAAVLEPDPAARQAGLNKALALFTALGSDENRAIYRASLDPAASGAADPEAYDPQVIFGIARIQYDLEKFSDAAANFSRLIVQRQLGSPLMPVERDGQIEYIDNDALWEAVYKLARCNMKLGTGIEESKSFLKQQYITWGDRVGGKKWRGQFEQLRRELIPDFTLSPTSLPA